VNKLSSFPGQTFMFGLIWSTYFRWIHKALSKLNFGFCGPCLMWNFKLHQQDPFLSCFFWMEAPCGGPQQFQPKGAQSMHCIILLYSSINPGAEVD
jgi:hypothetical protein